MYPFAFIKEAARVLLLHNGHPAERVAAAAKVFRNEPDWMNLPLEDQIEFQRVCRMLCDERWLRWQARWRAVEIDGRILALARKHTTKG